METAAKNNKQRLSLISDIKSIASIIGNMEPVGAAIVRIVKEHKQEDHVTIMRSGKRAEIDIGNLSFELLEEISKFLNSEYERLNRPAD